MFLKKVLSFIGTIGQRNKYGAESNAIIEVTMAADVILKAASGRFVTIDSSGNAALTTTSDATICGFIDAAGTQTMPATAGKIMQCDMSLDKIYRIPVSSGTYVRATHRGTLMDLVTSAGQQGAAVGTSDDDHLICVGGDEVNNKWVLVKINGAIQDK